MSNSPNQFSQLSPDHEYLKAFDELGIMIGRGKSFSGNERNCLFLNLGHGEFADLSSATGFDFIDDGRSVAVSDWDGDGDLDFWVNNRTSPRVRFLQNSFIQNNQFLAVRLQGEICNRDAIGARVVLHLTGDRPRTIIKTLRAGDGFLSQSSKTIHFGFRKDEQIKNLGIRWPGNHEFQVVDGLLPNRRYKITQSRQPSLLAPSPDNPTVSQIAARNIEIQPGSEETFTTSDTSRLFLTRPRPLPTIDYLDQEGDYLDQEGDRHDLSLTPESSYLITLWASWCPPCVEELTEFTEQAEQLTAAKVEVIALSTDGIENHTESIEQAEAVMSKIDWPFQFGMATKQSLAALTKLQHQVVYYERPLPLPTSFLVNPKGNVAAIYKGRVKVGQLLSDVEALNRSGAALAETVFPFPGSTASRIFADEVGLISALTEAGFVDDARAELLKRIEIVKSSDTTSAESNLRKKRTVAALLRQLGQFEQEQQNLDAATRAYQESLKYAPRHPVAYASLATIYADQGKQDEAKRLLDRTLKLDPNNDNILTLVASTYEALDDLPKAITLHRRAMQLDPNDLTKQVNLATVLQSAGDSREAVKLYRRVLEANPNSVDAANNLAWILATSDDPDLRDADAAMKLAQRVAYLTRAREPSALDTLAAALAANDNYERAADVAGRALELAQRQRLDDLAAKIKTRLSSYQAFLP